MWAEWQQSGAPSRTRKPGALGIKIVTPQFPGDAGPIAPICRRQVSLSLALASIVRARSGRRPKRRMQEPPRSMNIASGRLETTGGRRLASAKSGLGSSGNVRGVASVPTSRPGAATGVGPSAGRDYCVDHAEIGAYRPRCQAGMMRNQMDTAPLHHARCSIRRSAVSASPCRPTAAGRRNKFVMHNGQMTIGC